MADAGVNQYTFHVEPVKNVSLTCRKVKEAGMKVCTYFIYNIFKLNLLN